VDKEMIRDSSRGYGLVSIVFHWVSALTVLFLFGLGVYLTSYGYYSPNYLPYAHLHYALGVVVFAFIVLRLIWRLTSKTPQSLSKSLAARIMIKLIKFSLYLSVFVVIVSGYLVCTSEGQSVSIFGLLETPALASLDTQGVNMAGLTHKFVAWGLFAIVVLHAMAALVHHFVVRDTTLVRMLKPKGY
jgi:cytochrome b561